MKKIISVFLFIYSSQLLACNYSDLYAHLAPLEDILATGVEDCTDDFIFDKSDACECAKNNMQKFQTPQVLDNKRKLPLLETLLEQTQIGLYDLSNDITALGNLDQTKQLKLKQNCDLENRLVNAPASSPLYQCKNSILDQTQRLKLARKIGKQFQAELKQRMGEIKPDNSGLIDRNLAKNKNSCGLSESFIQKLNKHAIIPQFQYLAELISEHQNNLGDANNLDEAIIKISNENNNDNLSLIHRKILENPALKQLADSPQFFQKILLQAKPTHELVNETLNSQSFSSELLKQVHNKCDQVFQNIEQTLCTPTTANLLPTDFEAMRSNLKKMEQSQESDYLASSAILANHYCENTQNSDFDLKSQNINKLLGYDLKGNTNKSLQQVAGENHQKKSAEPGNQICKFMPPPLEKLESEIQKNCPQDDTSLLNQKCLLLKAIKTEFAATKEAQLSQIDELALKQAKAEAKKSGSENDEEGILEKATQIAKELKEKVDVEAIMDALKNGDQNERSPIVADFIGGTPSSNSNDTASSEETSFREFDQSQSNSESFATAMNQNNQIDANGNTVSANLSHSSAQTPRQKQVQREMNQVYQEIARRISKRPNKASANSSRSNSTPGRISQDLAHAIEPPYPQQEYSDNFEAQASEQTNILVDNYYGRPQSQSTESSENNFIAPTQPQTSEEEQREQYNNALAQTEAAKRVMSSNSPIPSGPPPVKVSGTTSTGALKTQIPELTIPAGNFDQAVNQLLKNSQLEQQNNSPGVNSEQTRLLLDLLDPKEGKSFILKDDNNPEFQVRIVKENGKLIIKEFIGNEADQDFIKFKQNIKRSVTLNGGLQGLIRKLKAALKGQPIIERAEPSANFREFSRSFN